MQPSTFFLVISAKELQMKSVLKWIAILLGGLFVLAIAVEAAKSPEQKAAESAERDRQTAIVARAEAELAKQELATLPMITAAELASAYDENTVAADQKFKNKKFKVIGTIVSINTDFFGDPYLALRGGVNQFMEPKFRFAKSDASQIAALKKGVQVKLLCVGKGDIAKTPMSDCKFF